MDAHRGENEMSNSYAAVSALIFAVVAIAHVVRLVNRWTVQVGPYNVSMNISWVALVVGEHFALGAVAGFGRRHLRECHGRDCGYGRRQCD